MLGLFVAVDTSVAFDLQHLKVDAFVHLLTDGGDMLEVHLRLPSAHEHAEAPAAVCVEDDVPGALVVGELREAVSDGLKLGDVVGAGPDCCTLSAAASVHY